MNFAASLPPVLKEEVKRAVVALGGGGEPLDEADAMVGACVFSDVLAPVDIDKSEVDRELLTRFDRETLHQHEFIPLRHVEGFLLVASSRPWDLSIGDTVQSAFPGETVKVTKLLILGNRLRSLFRDLELSGSRYDRSAAEVEAAKDDGGFSTNSSSLSDTGDGEIDAVFLKLIRNMADRDATDIFLEPTEFGEYKVRAEIHGELTEFSPLPAKVARPLEPIICRRIGVMSDKRHQAKQGTCPFLYKDRRIQLRVQTVPVWYLGNDIPHHITIRLQDSVRNEAIPLDRIYPPEVCNRVVQLVTTPGSLNMFTGPTGSGKSFTMAACMKVLNRPNRKLYSLESPPEILMPGVTQIPVQDGEFPIFMRLLLRSRPTAVMVGEIRDRETGAMALELSKTGPIVLTTIHAKYSWEVHRRSFDVGISYGDFAEQTSTISSQRLLKIVCKNCSSETKLTAETVRIYQLPEKFANSTVRAHNPDGCPHCHFGYESRKGIIEILPLTNKMREKIAAGIAPNALKDLAIAGGMKTLLHQAYDELEAGNTDLDAILEILSTTE